MSTSINAALDLKKVEKISKALGDPYRLKIIEMIKKQRCAMACSELIDTFNLSQSTISHHVKQLIDADLIIPEKEGRYVSYQVNKEVISSYIKFLRNIGD